MFPLPMPSGGYPFSLGVASGDPTPDGSVLWTRLAPEPLAPRGGGMPPEPVAVDYVIAADEATTIVVRRGRVPALPQLAHSVHVEPTALQPDREYWYQFRYGDDLSPVGRTKTTPAYGASVPRLDFALASCQSWSSGLLLRLLPPRRGRPRPRGAPGRLRLRGRYPVARRVPADPGPCPAAPDLPGTGPLAAAVRAVEDRPGSAARARQIPLDPHVGRPRGPERLRVGDLAVRGGRLRPAGDAYQAYYEHQPLGRTSIPRTEEMRLYRRLQYGALAQFDVLDGRQYRSVPPCGWGEVPACTAAYDPSVTMLGDAQERWLRDGLTASGARWNVLANNVMMGRLDHDGPSGDILWHDAWDGFPAGLSGRGHGVRRHVHLHNGDDIVYGPYYGPMIKYNPHIRFFDGDRRGYVRCTVEQSQWRTDLRMVRSVGSPDSPDYTFASFVVEDGVPGAQQI